MIAKNIVIWGAGRIGRGFVADLFRDEGYSPIFVDKSADLIALLNERAAYTVVRTQGIGRHSEVTIGGYKAFTTDQGDHIRAALIDADLLAVAVYPQQFDEVAAQLASHIMQRHAERPEEPLNILLFTNLPHARPKFRTALEQSLPAQFEPHFATYIGIVETLVIRIVAQPPAEAVAKDPLIVWTNGFAELPADRSAFVGTTPAWKFLRLVDDMRAEEMRKIYTYNMAHAVLAYQGYLRSCESIMECLEDTQVRAEAEGALEESSQALQREYGFSAEEMDAWIAAVVEHTSNPTLGDTVRRFGGDPRRKLARDDRLVGPALLAKSQGIEPYHLARAIAAGLYFTPEGDPGADYVHETIAEVGIKTALRKICDLRAGEEDLVQAIIRAYRRLPLEIELAERARKAYQLGFEYERVYHGCGQTTLAAILESLDMFDERVFESTTGLAGGVGLCGDANCSALTGAALAIGLMYPRRREHFDGDREAKYRTYSMIQHLHDLYIEKYGSIICGDIHRRIMGRAFNLRDPSEMDPFEAAGAHREKCTDVVGQAAQWAVRILGQELIDDQLASEE